jgi:outer membrane protein assembly factor BamA
LRLRRVAALVAFAAIPCVAQQPAAQPPAETGWEWFVLPTLNFSSDDGFGYGALLDLYNYGDGVTPYRFMIRPIVLLTTKGRRDIVLLIDAPRLLPRGWRFDAFVGREQQLATPYFGIGNETVNDTTLSDQGDDFYYRYGKTQLRVAANVQRELSRSVRLIAGAGLVDVELDATPFDSGTTLLLQQLQQRQGVAAPTLPNDRYIFVRGGAVLDTRDREIGPTRGHWVDLLVQGANLNAGSSFARVTISARKYASLTSRLVFAQRLVVQQVNGGTPFFDLPTLQASQVSSSQPEGLGGGGSVRGISRNRYVGDGIAFSNSELRWRFKELKLLGKPAYLVGSAFLDAGRVWDGAIAAEELFSDLHAGYGGGLRLGLGPSFLVAFDFGKSSESTQIYIGLGYPF